MYIYGNPALFFYLVLLYLCQSNFHHRFNTNPYNCNKGQNYYRILSYIFDRTEKPQITTESTSQCKSSRTTKI